MKRLRELWILLVVCLISIQPATSNITRINTIDSLRKVDPDQALALTRELLKEQKPDSKQRAYIFYQQGLIYYKNLADKENAIGSFYNSLNHYRKIDDVEKQYASLTYLGLCYKNLYQYDYALEYYEEILALPNIKVHSLNSTKYNIAETLRLKKAYKQALSLFEEILPYYQVTDNIKWQTKIHLGMALTHLENESYDESSKNYEDALALSIQEADSTFIGRCFNSLGYIDLVQNNLEQAEINLKEGLAFKTSANDLQTIITSYLNLGELYKKKGQLRKSLAYFEQASKLNAKYVDAQKLIEALETLASDAKNREDYKTAESFRAKITEVATPYVALSQRLDILHSQYQAERVYQLNENQELQASLAIERQRLIIICLAGIILLIGIIWLAQHYRRLRRVDDDLIIYLKRHVKVLNRIGLRYSINVDKMLAQVEKEEKARS